LELNVSTHLRGIGIIEEKKKDSDLANRAVANLQKDELWALNWKPTFWRGDQII
jgi:hypothetical protein